MKKFCLIASLLYAVNSFAQNGIDGLINAEKSFAAYAVANGTKDAFLKFLDSAGIVFENGKPVNGIEVWSKREKQEGVLNWHPQFAEVSLSGDFGYTSGPWTFQPQTINDSIVASGQFNSVWRMDKRGEWKNILDIGNNMPVATSNDIVKIEAIRLKKTVNPASEMNKAEDTFIKLFQKNTALAYQQFLSKQSILNHNEHTTATTKNKQKILVASTSHEIQFAVTGFGISEASDLGYVYGSSQLGDKKDNYLRIWRREKSGWKIALEVLHH